MASNMKSQDIWSQMQQPDPREDDADTDADTTMHHRQAPPPEPYEVEEFEGEDNVGTMSLDEVAYDRDKKWCR
jgi:hypothetical protein